MEFDEHISIPTPFEIIRIGVTRSGAPRLTADQRARARRASSLISLGIEWRDPHIVLAALRIHHALHEGAYSAAAFRPRRLDTSRFTTDFLEELARAIELELNRGRLVVIDGAQPLLATSAEFELTDRQPPIEAEPPPPSPPRRPVQQSLTSFEVRLVDEVGQAINGLEVEFAVAGDTHGVTTNAAGIALLDNASGFSASVAVVSTEALEKLVDPRWEKPRSGKAPSGPNTQVFAFSGGDIAGIALKPVVLNTVVITPPLGRLFVELFDKTGRSRHAAQSYEIAGPMSFAGKTDEAGRLVHDDVFPGDYELTLHVEVDPGDGEKIVDSYTSSLVVLEPADAEPKVRMLGAVPRVVLARMRGMFFDTNKAFLLPTALESLKKIRDIYFDNDPSELLIVGHTDTSGEPDFNDKLSLERAESVEAYLKDEVDPWLAFYESSVVKKKRWGKREDRMMLVSLPDFPSKPAGEDAVRWFQRTRGLKVDGKAGPQTRRQLITEYMALDGASLSESGLQISVTTHGCGENFPLGESGESLDEEPADAQRDQLDRRVELFFFDSEFGIRPPPPGKNSKPGSTEYPTWRERAAETHIFEGDAVSGPSLTFIEFVDALFRSNSAVVLPEGEAPVDDGETHESLTSVGTVASALRFNQENPGKTLLVAGHCDTTNTVDFNQKLSEERADCALALLVGDREAFKTLCHKRHKVSDYKQILSWVSQAFSDLVFDCHPGLIDDNAATGVEPVRRFQRAYNRNKAALGASGPDLEPDGAVGPLTWGAMFDCYEFALREELGEKPEGLAELRGRLAFVDPERKALGFSEHHPIEELGRDNFKSQANRRVEILFFDPGEEPDVQAAEEDPETSEIYLPGFYRREPVPPRANGLRTNLLSVQLLDSNRRPLPGVGYHLEVPGAVFDGVTDENAFLRERLQKGVPGGRLTALGVTVDLVFADLPPGDAPAGVQHRLSNLGVIDVDHVKNDDDEAFQDLLASFEDSKSSSHKDAVNEAIVDEGQDSGVA